MFLNNRQVATASYLHTAENMPWNSFQTQTSINEIIDYRMYEFMTRYDISHKLAYF